MKSFKLRLCIAFGGAISFAAGLGQLSGCAEGTQQEIVDSGPDIVFRPRGGNEGGAEGGVTCTVNPCVVDIAASGTSTCALIQDGTVRCWGDNASGELGTNAEGGTVSESATPLAVSGVTGAIRLAGGGEFAASSYDYDVSCAATSAGPLCWGSNEYAMLGRVALPADGLPHPDPSAVTGITGAALVMLGLTHGCALSSGSLACWGSNTYQQLGNGLMDGSTDYTTPVSVPLPSGKKALDAALGFAHTCAILDDKSVACWGYDGEYECGLVESSGYYQSTPYVVPGVSNVARITAGEYHTCVVTGDGNLSCWGYNYQGMLGNVGDGGSSTAAPLPIALPGGHKAIDVAAGTYSTCALLDDGTVACWGYNTYGQVGVAADASGTVVSTPTLIAGLNQVVQITMGAGSEHVCARIAGGSVKCWGANNYGQLGASSSEGGAVGSMSATPVSVQF